MKGVPVFQLMVYKYNLPQIQCLIDQKLLYKQIELTDMFVGDK